MTLVQFLSAIQAIAALKPSYLKGHSGDDGFCDCIGLIIGALERCAIPWKVIHGSNWAARHEVLCLHKVSRASDLKLGDIVFKAYEPHTSGWKLPERYKGDPDQKDYFHVGVVTQVSPLKITHMTSPTIKVDTKIGKWSYAATLKYISASEAPSVRELSPEATEGVDVNMTATVVSDDGNPVKLRPTASTSQPYVVKIPVGTTVFVLEKGEEWSRITALGKTGYIMTKFLRFNDGSQAFVTLTLPADVASALRDALNMVI